MRTILLRCRHCIQFTARMMAVSTVLSSHTSQPRQRGGHGRGQQKDDVLSLLLRPEVFVTYDKLGLSIDFDVATRWVCAR